MAKIVITEDHNRGTMYFTCKAGDVLKLVSKSTVRFGAGDYAYQTESGYVDVEYAERIMKIKEKK